VWPERRWCHAVRLADGSWAANLHAHNRPPERALADTERALAAARDWSAGAPLVFGGDVNLRRPPALPGVVHVAGNHVDHLFARGLSRRGAEVLDAAGLSDHAPVVAVLG
jgi:endonuclease/exonuclease/phosphatase family metal-dependent hydrolase